MGVQGKNGIKVMKATFASKMAITLITLGVLGMTISLTVAGYGQVLVERAQMGATWEGFFVSQDMVWFCSRSWMEISNWYYDICWIFILS